MNKVIQNYVLHEEIGKGAFAIVYRGTKNNDQIKNKQYAIKAIKIDKLKKNKKLFQYTLHQVKFLSQINNQYIIRYYDLFKTKNHYYIIYEYCNQGTLFDLLNRQKHLQQNKALIYFKQLLQAFKVLHQHKLLHRDLKPQNIFLNSGKVKLGDFGLCKRLEYEYQETSTQLGSPFYMAPQVLQEKSYSCKADIWPLGVVLFHMLNGTVPFKALSIPSLIKMIHQKTNLQLDKKYNISVQVKKLIERMLTINTQDRITWKELFSIQITEQGEILPEKKDYEMPLNLPIKEQMQFLKVNLAQSQQQSQQGSTQSSHKSIKNPEIFLNIFFPNNQPKVNFFDKQDKEESKEIKKNFDVQHKQILKGFNLANDIVKQNEKYYYEFTYHIFKNINQRLQRLKTEIQAQSELKSQFSQLLKLVESDINTVQNKVAQFKNILLAQQGNSQSNLDKKQWKQALQSKIEEYENLKLGYQLITFLSGKNLTNDQTLPAIDLLINIRDAFNDKQQEKKYRQFN